MTIEWIKDKIGFDGLLHFVVSAIIAHILCWFFEPLIAGIITVNIGVFKELYDYYTERGSAEFKDIMCNILGAIVGI